MSNNSKRFNALTASRVGVFAALYAVLSLVPVSMFIGAPSFLALNLIVTPAVAILLNPLEALLASTFGGILAFYVSPSQAMFGPLTVLLPIAGSTFGSLVYHKRKLGALATMLFLVTAVSAYLIVNSPFPYFVIPHITAILVVLATLFKKMTPLSVKIPLFTFVSTMCEQGMMMIFAVHLLGMPWQAFVGILPLMIYERLIGTVGATIVIISLMRIIPKHFSERTI